jgi:hypothetical protein
VCLIKYFFDVILNKLLNKKLLLKYLRLSFETKDMRRFTAAIQNKRRFDASTVRRFDGTPQT